MNILVVRTDKLGDFITALPALYILKQHNPDNRIIACVAPGNRELAEVCDFIDDVIVDDGGSLWKFSDTLRKARFDASVTLFSNTRVAMAQWLARIPVRIAPATKIAQFFYTKRIRQRRSQVRMAEFEYNVQLTKALFGDIDCKYRQPILQPETARIEAARRLFSERFGVAKPVIALHPGFGGSSDANLTPGQYAELAKLAARHHNIQVVMTFGPDETSLRQTMVELTDGTDVIFYTSKEGLVAFAALLSTFKLFVSTSTGPYHLASALGTPTMTFFADTLFASVKRWKGVGTQENQNPYMLSAEAKERQTQFERIKQDLDSLISQHLAV